MIRPAVAADVDGIAAVQARGWQAAYRGIVPEATLRKVTVEHRSKMWAGARLGARAPEWPVFVAEWDGAVVGMAAVGPPRDQGFHYDAELYALYVDPPLGREPPQGCKPRGMNRDEQRVVACSYFEGALGQQALRIGARDRQLESDQAARELR